MPLRTFFTSSFGDICLFADFSGQNKFSWVTIFKACLRFVLDLVQNLYSIALQCVFPVLLFNPHTSDLIWMKTDYNVHISAVLSQPASFPPPHRRGCCAWLPLLGLRGTEGRYLAPVPCLWGWGRQLPVAATSWGHECHACCLLIFPPEFRLTAITFSANVEATPEETKQVHSVIEDGQGGQPYAEQLPASPPPVLGSSISTLKERAMVVHVQSCNLQKQNYCARQDVCFTVRFLVTLYLCFNSEHIKT